jgi:poly-beta-1,6-N-acetyl-D-glucosamine synthase
LNLGVASATGDIVVFTDARQDLEPGAIAVLVAQLAADDVGAVSGALEHRDPSTHEASNIGLYWRYERAIREAESRWNSTVGATGALYAIRRSDYVPIADDTILDDFEIPMLIVRRGRRALIDRRAVVCDELQTDLRGEHVRKVRTLTGNFQSLARHRWMLSPRSNPVFWQLIFHKVLRLFMPYALLAAWVTSAMSPAPAMRIAFGLQTAGYLVVAAAYVFGNLKRVPGLGALVVFVDLNMAAVQALFRYAAGTAATRWEKTS